MNCAVSAPSSVHLSLSQFKASSLLDSTLPFEPCPHPYPLLSFPCSFFFFLFSIPPGSFSLSSFSPSLSLLSFPLSPLSFSLSLSPFYSAYLYVVDDYSLSLVTSFSSARKDGCWCQAGMTQVWHYNTHILNPEKNLEAEFGRLFTQLASSLSRAHKYKVFLGSLM
jgi:hypothetical protein